MQEQLDVGAWGLFSGPNGRQLVLVGDQPCGPTSARKHTRSLPRRLLLDEERIAQAFARGTTTVEAVEHAGQKFIVHLQPLLSPKSETVMAVLAGVCRMGEELPEPPLVGCWEWQIERNADGSPNLNRRSYWDSNVARIYDVSPDVAQQVQGYWEVGDWANELIDQADQMRLNSSIRDVVVGAQWSLASLCDKLYAITYNVVTGYGTQTRGRRHLRAVAFLPHFTAEDEHLRLLGFSHEVAASYNDMTLDHDINSARVDDVLRGVMELAKEPMAVVDTETLDVLMTSSSWRREDFGTVGGLCEVVDHESGELQTFIVDAAEDSSMRPRSMRTTLRRVNGSIQDVLMTVTGVESRLGRDAVVRLDF